MHRPKKEERVCCCLEILIVFARIMISRSADDALSNAYIMKMKELLQSWLYLFKFCFCKSFASQSVFVILLLLLRLFAHSLLCFSIALANYAKRRQGERSLWQQTAVVAISIAISVSVAVSVTCPGDVLGNEVGADSGARLGLTVGVYRTWESARGFFLGLKMCHLQH